MYGIYIHNHYVFLVDYFIREESVSLPIVQRRDKQR